MSFEDGTAPQLGCLSASFNLVIEAHIIHMLKKLEFFTCGCSTELVCALKTSSQTKFQILFLKFPFLENLNGEEQTELVVHGEDC